MSNDSNVTVSKAFEIICKFLTKEWPLASESDLTISALKGGYVNSLYVVENHAVSGSKKEPRKVLLRFYGGNVLGDNKRQLVQYLPMNSEVEESMLFMQQSMTGCGPKLYGVFTGGIVQEFIPSHTLRHEEASQPDMITNLAKAYARFHQHQMPLDRTKIDVLLKINPYPKEIFDLPIFKELNLDMSSVLSIDRHAEMELAKKLMKQVSSKEVLLHFDCQYLNVLVREDPSPDSGSKVALIDYEISFYGPRMLDIGGHFSSRQLDALKKDSKASGYPYPSEDQRRLFIQEYLKEIERLDPDNFHADFHNNEDHLMLESEVGSLIYSFLLMNSVLPMADRFLGDPILFTALQVKAEFYFKQKQYLMSKYPELFTKY